MNSSRYNMDASACERCRNHGSLEELDLQHARECPHRLCSCPDCMAIAASSDRLLRRKTARYCVRCHNHGSWSLRASHLCKYEHCGCLLCRGGSAGVETVAASSEGKQGSAPEPGVAAGTRGRAKSVAPAVSRGRATTPRPAGVKSDAASLGRGKRNKAPRGAARRSPSPPQARGRSRAKSAAPRGRGRAKSLAPSTVRQESRAKSTVPEPAARGRRPSSPSPQVRKGRAKSLAPCSVRGKRAKSTAPSPVRGRQRVKSVAPRATRRKGKARSSSLSSTRSGSRSSSVSPGRGRSRLQSTARGPGRKRTRGRSIAPSPVRKAMPRRCRAKSVAPASVRGMSRSRSSTPGPARAKGRAKSVAPAPVRGRRAKSVAPSPVRERKRAKSVAPRSQGRSRRRSITPARSRSRSSSPRTVARGKSRAKSVAQRSLKERSTSPSPARSRVTPPRESRYRSRAKSVASRSHRGRSKAGPNASSPASNRSRSSPSRGRSKARSSAPSPMRCWRASTVFRSRSRRRERSESAAPRPLRGRSRAKSTAPSPERIRSRSPSPKTARSRGRAKSVAPGSPMGRITRARSIAPSPVRSRSRFRSPFSRAARDRIKSKSAAPVRARDGAARSPEQERASVVSRTERRRSRARSVLSSFSNTSRSGSFSSSPVRRKRAKTDASSSKRQSRRGRSRARSPSNSCRSRSASGSSVRSRAKSAAPHLVRRRKRDKSHASSPERGERWTSVNSGSSRSSSQSPTRRNKRAKYDAPRAERERSKARSSPQSPTSDNSRSSYRSPGRRWKRARSDASSRRRRSRSFTRSRSRSSTTSRSRSPSPSSPRGRSRAKSAALSPVRGMRDKYAAGGSRRSRKRHKRGKSIASSLRRRRRRSSSFSSNSGRERSRSKSPCCCRHKSKGMHSSRSRVASSPLTSCQKTKSNSSDMACPPSQSSHCGVFKDSSCGNAMPTKCDNNASGCVVCESRSKQLELLHTHACSCNNMDKKLHQAVVCVPQSRCCHLSGSSNGTAVPATEEVQLLAQQGLNVSLPSECPGNNLSCAKKEKVLLGCANCGHDSVTCSQNNLSHHTHENHRCSASPSLSHVVSDERLKAVCDLLASSDLRHAISCLCNPHQSLNTPVAVVDARYMSCGEGAPLADVKPVTIITDKTSVFNRSGKSANNEEDFNLVLDVSCNASENSADGLGNVSNSSDDKETSGSQETDAMTCKSSSEKVVDTYDPETPVLSGTAAHEENSSHVASVLTPSCGGGDSYINELSEFLRFNKEVHGPASHVDSQVFSGSGDNQAQNEPHVLMVPEVPLSTVETVDSHSSVNQVQGESHECLAAIKVSTNQQEALPSGTGLVSQLSTDSITIMQQVANQQDQNVTREMAIGKPLTDCTTVNQEAALLPHDNCAVNQNPPKLPIDSTSTEQQAALQRDCVPSQNLSKLSTGCTTVNKQPFLLHTDQDQNKALKVVNQELSTDSTPMKQQAALTPNNVVDLSKHSTDSTSLNSQEAVSRDCTPLSQQAALSRDPILDGKKRFEVAVSKPSTISSSMKQQIALPPNSVLDRTRSELSLDSSSSEQMVALPHGVARDQKTKLSTDSTLLNLKAALPNDIVRARNTTQLPTDSTSINLQAALSHDTVQDRNTTELSTKSTTVNPQAALTHDIVPDQIKTVNGTIGKQLTVPSTIMQYRSVTKSSRDSTPPKPLSNFPVLKAALVRDAVVNRVVTELSTEFTSIKPHTALPRDSVRNRNETVSTKMQQCDAIQGQKVTKLPDSMKQLAAFPCQSVLDRNGTKLSRDSTSKQQAHDSVKDGKIANPSRNFTSLKQQSVFPRGTVRLKSGTNLKTSITQFASMLPDCVGVSKSSGFTFLKQHKSPPFTAQNQNHSKLSTDSTFIKEQLPIPRATLQEKQLASLLPDSVGVSKQSSGFDFLMHQKSLSCSVQDRNDTKPSIDSSIMKQVDMPPATFQDQNKTKLSTENSSIKQHVTLPRDSVRDRNITKPSVSTSLNQQSTPPCNSVCNMKATKLSTASASTKEHAPLACGTVRDQNPSLKVGIRGPQTPKDRNVSSPLCDINKRPYPSVSVDRSISSGLGPIRSTPVQPFKSLAGEKSGTPATFVNRKVNSERDAGRSHRNECRQGVHANISSAKPNEKAPGNTLAAAKGSVCDDSFEGDPFLGFSDDDTLARAASAACGDSTPHDPNPAKGSDCDSDDDDLFEEDLQAAIAELDEEEAAKEAERSRTVAEARADSGRSCRAAEGDRDSSRHPTPHPHRTRSTSRRAKQEPDLPERPPSRAARCSNSRKAWWTEEYYGYDINEKNARYCAKCKNHELKVRVKGHKGFCPFELCDCVLCSRMGEKRSSLEARRRKGISTSDDGGQRKRSSCQELAENFTAVAQGFHQAPSLETNDVSSAIDFPQVREDASVTNRIEAQTIPEVTVKEEYVCVWCRTSFEAFLELHNHTVTAHPEMCLEESSNVPDIALSLNVQTTVTSGTGTLQPQVNNLLDSARLSNATSEFSLKDLTLQNKGTIKRNPFSDKNVAGAFQKGSTPSTGNKNELNMNLLSAPAFPSMATNPREQTRQHSFVTKISEKYPFVFKGNEHLISEKQNISDASNSSSYSSACVDCRLSFRSRSDSAKHHVNHHAQPQTFKCSSCRVSHESLLRHEIHTTLSHSAFYFGCLACSAKFPSEHLLRIHMSCDHQEALAAHMSISHPDERLFSCSCGYKFNNLLDLKIHHRCHIIRKADHHCPVCFVGNSYFK